MRASGGRRDQERARQQVIRKLYEFINPLTGGMDGKGWPFGRSLRLPDVMAALITIPGVDRIYSIRLFLVTHDEDGQPIRPGEEREEIAVGMDQVIVSDQHHVVLE
jgi:hypothetical protein